MKKLVFIVAFFISQVCFGQNYTFQVFSNYEDFFVGEGQIAEPFHSFLNEHGSYNPDITGPWVLFEDDPGNYIFPMFVVSEQANALEDLLSNSDIIFKFLSYNGETEFVLDRLWFRYFVDQIPEFLGIQNGIVQTDNEALNLVFEEFQVDNYAQTFPSSTNPFLFSVHQIRCNECDIFELVQELSTIQIIEFAELVGYDEILLNINENELLSQSSIFPNPNNGRFEIQLNSNELIGTQLTIFDALGRKVYDEKLLQTNNIIHLNSISPGIYFARLDNNGKSSVKKFIVNN